MRSVAGQAGAQPLIAQLPAQYETMLGKLFAGGCELSSGEWQRIALARAFWRQAPVMLLDEPTSALDSWSEADWFERLRCLAAGKTVVLITHRFTLAKEADLIYVMDRGCIIEAGAHEELLRKRGHYAQAWRLQVEKTVPHERIGLGVNGVLPEHNIPCEEAETT
jgi:ATP-binding cassette subfamily B protein